MHLPPNTYQVTHDPLPAAFDPPGVQGFPESPYNLSAWDTQLVITDLTPNTNYSVTVCAFTSVGCGPLSSRVNQTDEEGKSLAFVNYSYDGNCNFLNSSSGSHQSGNHFIKRQHLQQQCNYPNHLDPSISAQWFLQLYAHVFC